MYIKAQPTNFMEKQAKTPTTGAPEPSLAAWRATGDYDAER
jgi:hypothetical protein